MVSYLLETNKIGTYFKVESGALLVRRNIDNMAHKQTSFQKLSYSDISEKILNSIPGIFYLYEKIGDQVFLKLWNITLVKVIGYTDEELLNMPGSTFFTEKEYKGIEKAIEKVFTEGKSQMRARILTKSGKQVSYQLEAYSFVEDDRHYMMGVGIDIKSQLKVERNLEKAINERNNLKQEKVTIIEQLESKKRKLIAHAIENIEMNRRIKTSLLDLNRIIDGHPQNELIQHLIDMRTNLEQQIKIKQDWKYFKLSFTELHHDFLTTLHIEHPSLTQSELRFCAYLKIHLTSYQIANIQNVTKGAVKQTRYRIRRKLDLVTKDSLEDYISRF